MTYIIDMTEKVLKFYTNLKYYYKRKFFRIANYI